MFLTLRHEIGRASVIESLFSIARTEYCHIFLRFTNYIELSVFVKIVEIYARSQHLVTDHSPRAKPYAY